MRLVYWDYIYVIFQFILFLLFLVARDINVLELPDWMGWLSILIVIFGALICLIAIFQLNTHLSPFPSPKANSNLISNGVFKYIRHPIYSGILLGFMGVSFYYGSLLKLLLTVLLFILFYFKSTYEEKRLSSFFKEYESYKAKTKRFIPFIF